MQLIYDESLASRFDRAWFQHLKLIYDDPLSNFAFKFNLRRYTVVEFVATPAVAAELLAGR